MQGDMRALADVVYSSLEEQAFDQLKECYKRYAGKVVCTRTLRGWRGADLVDVSLQEPLPVRVVQTPLDMVLGLPPCDGWLDSQWYVEPLVRDPLLDDLRNLSIYGISVHVTTGETDPSPAKLEADHD